MVSYVQAREIALSRMSNKTWFNCCSEYEHAFVFSKWDDFSFGGISPCAVMKDTGAALNFVAAIDELGDFIRVWMMAPDGSLTATSLEEIGSLADAKLSDLN